MRGPSAVQQHIARALPLTAFNFLLEAQTACQKWIVDCHAAASDGLLLSILHPLLMELSRERGGYVDELAGGPTALAKNGASAVMKLKLTTLSDNRTHSI